MMMLQGLCWLPPNWYDIILICPYQEMSQQMIVPFVIAKSSLISLQIQANRAYGSEICQRLFVISFVILYVCNIVHYW
jgi:hypothetical protein